MKGLRYLVFIIVTCCCVNVVGWGFFGHKHIVEWSIYSLPTALFDFYKPYKSQLKTYAVLPDVLKNSIPKEYARHYIDLEHYDNLSHLRLNIDSCLKIDSCYDRGILPFIIKDEFNKLVTLFNNGQVESILRQSGVLSHYCSDLCVPLHTTVNYNGQLTGQNGIHALWESYLLEKFYPYYDLYGIKAQFEKDIEGRILRELEEAHRLVIPLLNAHAKCQIKHKENTFGFYMRNNELKKGYSEHFQSCFHDEISSQIEGQFIRSIQLTSDLWFSAWILAGKPDLNHHSTPIFVRNLEEEGRHSTRKLDKRQHE